MVVCCSGRKDPQAARSGGRRWLKSPLNAGALARTGRVPASAPQELEVGLSGLRVVPSSADSANHGSRDIEVAGKEWGAQSGCRQLHGERASSKRPNGRTGPECKDTT